VSSRARNIHPTPRSPGDHLPTPRLSICHASAAALLKKAFKRINGIGAGLLCQFVLLPAFGFLSLTLFPQSPTVAVTLLVVTTSPGGGFSGWWCFLCNADLALSVAMTTASTIVSVFALPVNLYLYITMLYGRSVSIDFVKLSLSVVVVVVAVVVGAAVGNRLPTKRWMVSLIGQVAGIALMGVGAIANTTSSNPLWENPPTWFAAITMPVMGGLSVAVLVARIVRLSSPEVRRAEAPAPHPISLQGEGGRVGWAITSHTGCMLELWHVVSVRYSARWYVSSLSPANSLSSLPPSLTRCKS